MEWLCNPKAKASTHYIVTRAGEIYQLVKEGDTAWGNGIVQKPNWKLYEKKHYNPNRYTVSIEHENYTGDGELGLTEAQYQATLYLHRDICLRYGIPVDSEHIVGHYRIDSVDKPNCPGKDFPWARLFKDLKGVEGLDKVPIKVKGETFEGIILSDRTWGPVRSILEKLGHKVEWDEKTKTVKIDGGV